MARLIFVEGPWKGVELSLETGEYVLGRDPECELAVPDTSLSRRHVHFTRRGDLWHAADMQSRNGTLVNHKPLTTAVLRDGDRLVVGRHTIAFSNHANVELRSTTTIVGEIESSRDDLARLLELNAALGRAPDADHVVEVSARWMLARIGGTRALVYQRRAGGMISDRVITRSDVDKPDHQPVPNAAIIEASRHGNTVWLGRKGRGLIIVPLGARSDIVLVVPDIAEPERKTLRVMTLAAHLCAAQLTSRFRIDTLASRLNEAGDRDDQLIATSPAMLPVLDFIERAASSSSTVLLLGDSGTGKELVSRALHRTGPRADAPFVAINCGSIPAGMLEAEMFGHELGAFTGASSRRRGCFELADGGSLLLDEVGELSSQAQAGLLRVLEERVVRRVGGEHPIPVDVRVIAATHRDLRAAVDAGTFREDLFFRLSVLVAHLPPLRDRPEDVEVLAGRFLERFRAQADRPLSGFTEQALSALRGYHWPGNVRELRNVVERAVILGRGPTIEPGDLPMDIAASARTRPDSIERVSLPMSSSELERRNLLAALASTDGNKTRAAALLGIDRVTLYNRLKAVDK